MRLLTTAILLLLLVAACGEAPEATTEPAVNAPPGDPVVIRLELEGMHCESCVNAITVWLEGVDGVVDATVDLESKSATVLVHPSTPVEALIRAVRGGYTARLAEASGDD